MLIVDSESQISPLKRDRVRAGKGCFHRHDERRFGKHPSAVEKDA